MLPHLNNDNESGQERPSLPSIRDLFGEQLSKPVNNRPSTFSLADLGSSLPSGSTSSEYSSGSILSSNMTSPWSARSHTSGQNTGHACTDSSYLSTGRRRSNSGSHFFTTPSTASSQDDYITLPPINPIYSQTYSDTEEHTSSPYVMTSSRRMANSHSRSHSTSETEVPNDAQRSDASQESSTKRRHTIGSSRSSGSATRPFSSYSRKTTRDLCPLFTSRPLILNPHPPPPTHDSLRRNYTPGVDHPSSTRNYTPVVDYRSPGSSGPPSPPSTSGEEDKKKAPAKYECQYCKKRFTRPSSLKLHYNTHTGEKPYACPIPGCGRHFSVLSNMRRHTRIHNLPPNTPMRRDSSVEDAVESYTMNSSSSTYDTPIIPQAEIIPSSEQYSLSSATSSFHAQTSSFRLQLRPSQARPHPYRRSRSSPSDRGESSPER